MSTQSWFNSTYHWLRLQLLKGRYALSSREQQVTIHGKTVTFPIGSFQQFRYLVPPTESEVIGSIMDDTSAGDVVWDVGSHLGAFALFLATQPSVEVVAFEPAPDNQRRIQAAVKVNGFSSVTVRGHALGAEKSTKRLRSQGDSSTYHFDDDGFEIDVQPGNSLSEVPAPSIVKIDVEGAELGVLKGMRRLLDGVAILYCEIHDDEEKSQITELLISHGFINQRTIRERAHHTIVRYAE